MAAARANSRVFEEYDPSVEWSFGAEADSVRILLPGFKREEIRVLVDNHGHLRTSGQRLIAGARWSRFQKDFQLPSNCNVEGIRAKFENETLTITLPKKTPSPPPPPVPVAPPQAPRPPVAAAPSQRIPPAIPEAQARPAPPPPTVPAAKLAPASSQKQPAAESRPSLPPAVEPPVPEVPARLPSVPTPAHVAAKPEQPALAAVPRPSEEEEAKRREREMMGKMEEDRKAAAAQEEEQRRDEAAAAMGEMEMARQPRPASASRGLLVNVAVAVVVLLGITAYVWHSLRNATGGDHGHGRMGAGSYGDEM